jgi:hypothetical protein
MRPGSPFKYRGSATPYVGMLSTPDVLKYKVPVPFAFVPSNPKYDPKQNKSEGNAKTRSVPVVQATSFQNSAECQKQVNNYNKCLNNNSADECAYYLNYLNLNCK